MKVSTALILGLVAGLSGTGAVAADGQRSREEELIKVLASNATPGEKDAACEQLKLFGTSRCIPALAALLPNERLSLSARYVLESMPLPEAERALLAALDQTAGPLEAGIISSLGARREVQAVPAVASRLYSQNIEVATAAARALGNIGAEAALKPLETAAARTHSQALRIAVADGLLRCAERLSQAGENSRALRVYERLSRPEQEERIRIAAYEGMMRVSGRQGLKLMARALEGPEGPARLAALQMTHELTTPGTTEALAAQLPRVESAVQAVLLDALIERGDPAVAPAVQSLTGKSEPEVRVRVLRALGALGDASVVPMLAQFASSGTDLERAAAREALVQIHRGDVTGRMVSELATSNGELQAELARALGDRGDQRAVERLLHVAERGPDTARGAAIKALGLLVDQPQLPVLIRYVVTTTNAAARAEASDALSYACQHILSKRGRIDDEDLVRSIVLGSSIARVALVPACSGLVGPRIRMGLRSVLQDPNPEVHAVAVRVLCNSIDPDLIEDIVVLARTTRDEKVRKEAIAAGVRLMSDEENARVSMGQRLAALKALLAAATQADQKKLVLAGLGEIPQFEALRSVEPLLEDEALHADAAAAAIKVATALPGSYARDSMAILSKGLAAAPDENSKRPIEAALSQLQDSIDYITDWVVAGPFRQPGKKYSDLFDVVFPPETDNPQGVDWKPLPAGTDPKRPYVMDLFRALGGQQCVAYARTWLHSEKEESVRLELGSDDGLRVWLNDKQVYALNQTRTLSPGSDKVDITLHPGWNMLLLKVTQNDLRWEFCARLLKPDGTHLDDLQVESAPKTAAATN